MTDLKDQEGVGKSTVLTAATYIIITCIARFCSANPTTKYLPVTVDALNTVPHAALVEGPIRKCGVSNQPDHAGIRAEQLSLNH